MKSKIAVGVAFVVGLGLAAAPAEAQRRDRDVITQEEILAAKTFTNSYEMVRSLRPQFLRPASGPRSLGGATQGAAKVTVPVVYVDEVKFGDLDVLKNIRTEDVKEIRYLRSGEAQARWGLGHEAGAIMVALVKRNP